MWAQKDEFQFVWKRMNGDFILQARVELVGKGVDPAPQVGRDGPPQPGRRLRRMSTAWCTATASPRSSSGAPRARSPSRSNRRQGRGRHPARAAGETYIFPPRSSATRSPACRSRTSHLGDDVYVGLSLCSHNRRGDGAGDLPDVRIIRPAKDGFVPYRDYIGSILEILDVQTRPAADHLPLRAALRGAELDATTARR